MSDEISLVKDLQTEALVVGCIYNKPELLDEYADEIASKYDFMETDIKTLYDTMLVVYYTYGTISDTSIHVHVSTMSTEEKMSF